MTLLISIIAIIVILSLILISKKPKKDTKELTKEYKYQKIHKIVTPAERSFLGVLDKAVGDKARVLTKVRIADVIKPEKTESKSEWYKAFNKISSKHFDYVLCKNDDLSIICAIELDDSSHNQEKTKKRDLFVNNACKSAKLPLLRVKAKKDYVMSEIETLIEPYI